MLGSLPFGLHPLQSLHYFCGHPHQHMVVVSWNMCGLKDLNVEIIVKQLDVLKSDLRRVERLRLSLCIVGAPGSALFCVDGSTGAVWLLSGLFAMGLG